MARPSPVEQEENIHAFERLSHCQTGDGQHQRQQYSKRIASAVQRRPAPVCTSDFQGKPNSPRQTPGSASR